LEIDSSLAGITTLIVSEPVRYSGSADFRRGGE
jgi:hypothetical protein